MSRLLSILVGVLAVLVVAGCGDDDSDSDSDDSQQLTVISGPIAATAVDTGETGGTGDYVGARGEVEISAEDDERVRYETVLA